MLGSLRPALRPKLPSLTARCGMVTRSADSNADGALSRFLPEKTTQSEKTTLMFTTADEAGGLMKTLGVFYEHGVNLARIESRLSKKSALQTEMIVDVDADLTTIMPVVSGLRELGCVAQVIGSPEVPWFPRAISELDDIPMQTLDAEAGDLDADHPGFTDADYRARRQLITANAQAYRTGDSIPRVECVASAVAPARCAMAESATRARQPTLSPTITSTVRLLPRTSLVFDPALLLRPSAMPEQLLARGDGNLGRGVPAARIVVPGACVRTIP